MSYFELLEHFWRLDAQASFSANETRLYFYLLNEFNAARWASKIYRRTNQVAADLNADPKTVDAARRQLEARELLTYVAGNKSASATWALGIERKNSGQSAADKVEMDGNFSGPFSPNPADRVEMDRKNSGPIRNRRRLEVEEDQTPPASECACVGEAAAELTPALLPTEILELVPPVALTPQPPAAVPTAEAGPVLSEALASEAKTLASTIGALWFITEQRNQPKWARIHTFCRRLALLGRIEEVQHQFAGYRLQREKAGLRPHQLDSWLGTPAHDFADGEWTGCDWPSVAAATTTRPGQQAPTPPARATTSARKTQSQTWS